MHTGFVQRGLPRSSPKNTAAPLFFRDRDRGSDRDRRPAERAESSETSGRAGLETFGLVHEHKYVMTRTSHVRWQKLRKKLRCGSWVVAPITMAATPAAFAGGGGRAAAASSTGTTIAEVSAGHRSPRSL